MKVARAIITVLLLVLVAAAVASSRSTKAPSHDGWASDILLQDDKAIIPIKDAILVRFSDTGSMKPTLDENTKGIMLSYSPQVNIMPGDIIIYKYKGRNIVHRVIGIEEDSEGIFYTTKGDNLIYKDKTKVRPDMILGKIIALIY